MGKAEGLDTLVAWQNARTLMKFVHKRIVPKFPTSERYDLTQQICRSSKSVMANIAEGYGDLKPNQLKESGIVYHP